MKKQFLNLSICIFTLLAFLMCIPQVVAAADRDGDGIENQNDNCPGVINFEQEDTDNDGSGH